VNVARVRLSELTDAELASIFRDAPYLAELWAQSAGVKRDVLASGSSRGLRALKVAIAREGDGLIATLQDFGTWLLRRELGEDALLDPTPESASELAAVAGEEFGPTAGALLLLALANGNDDLAKVIAPAVDDLIEVATNAARERTRRDLAVADSPDTGDSTTPEGEALDTDLDIDADFESPSFDSGNALCLIDELIAQAPDIAAALRRCAGEVDALHDIDTELHAVTAWSASVNHTMLQYAHTAPAAGLRELRERLHEASQARVQRLTQLREAARAVRSLRDQGLDRYIPTVLQEEGFSSLDDLGAELDAAGITGDDLDTEPVRITDAATRPEPAKSHETAGPIAASPADTDSVPLAPEGTPVVPQDEPSPTAVPIEEATDATSMTAQMAARALDEVAADGLQPGKPPEEAPSEPVSPSEQSNSATTSPPPAGSHKDPQPQADPTQGLAAKADSPAERSGVQTDGDRDTDDLLNFPWDAGHPPLLARLLDSGDKDALAVLLADAAGEKTARRQMLRLFCAAYTCQPQAVETELPRLVISEEDLQRSGVDECRLLLAACLRIGLSLGYSPVGLPSLMERTALTDTGLRDVLQAAADAVKRGYRRQPGDSDDTAGLHQEWAAYDQRALDLLSSLAERHYNFVRAMKVARHIARSDQPVGQALAAVSELARTGVDSASDREPTWQIIRTAAEELADDDKRDRLIDATDRLVSTAPQLRKPIIASAKAKLHEALGEAADLLSSFLGLRAAARQTSGADADLAGVVYNLQQAVGAVPESTGTESVGTVALERLVRWLRADIVPATSPSLDAALNAAQQPLFEIPRDADQRPDRQPTLEEIEILLEGREPDQVVRGYIGSGNLEAARTVMSEAGIPPNTPLDDELLRGARAAKRALVKELDTVDRIAAQLRALYVDEEARQITAKADALRQADPERLDLALVPLRQLASSGAHALESFIEGLRGRIAASACSEVDRSRMLDLLERGDAILAVDFLTRVESGLPLPEVTPPHGDDFSEFFPAVVDAALAARDNAEDVFAAVRQLLGTGANTDSRQIIDGLAAWNELKSKRRALPSQDVFRAQVANLVRFIGLVPRNQAWMREITTTQRAGFASFRVRATPVDRSYIPSLGTQAHQSYDVTLVWDSATPGRLLDFIDERSRNHANVIIYFGLLDKRQRLDLRMLTTPGRGKGVSPIVVDEAVAAWLATRPEAGWRLTQRVTLPFTSLNPYTPFAGGEVPDEVFVGRETERAAIESPTGSMFVYGGRQLGKSALLRRVERMFTDEHEPAQGRDAWAPRSGKVAVYLDLKAASIGEMQQPSALWAVLAERLQAAQVLSPKTKANGADQVTSQIDAWLRRDEGNRLLLLLDEADNFLTADFQDATGGRTGTFPTLQRLKGIMEASHRRFKPVFAGLHQVQRFHDTSNTPVAHGGADILIGPLRSQDAYHLVVDPMQALGYIFSSPELVWRLLLFTNYQASLVQIVCEALVRHLQDRPLPEGGGRVIIEDVDVDAIYAKSEVRNLIAQRFRWTINLDSHYRVIALVVALNSLDAAPGEAFSVNDLREQCEVFWPEGFATGTVSGKEFHRYLDEMVGLGVLHRQGDDYGLRSPTIINLLGSREALDQELHEASRHLELEYEYNPMMNRRIVGSSTTLWAPRSPLNDHDLATLLPQQPGEAECVVVVTGSQALAVDRVASALEAVAGERQLACTTLTAEQLPEGISAARGRQHLIVDLSTAATSATLSEVCSNVATRQGTTATVILGPALISQLDSVDVPVIAIRRWSMEGLRSWHESPFDTPVLRARLYRVTAGWPYLVERAMREVADGRAPDDALDVVEHFLADPETARQHIAATGIELDLAARWAEWLSTRGEDGLVEAQPASLADLQIALERDSARTVLSLQPLDLVEEADGGWTLDRVTIAAASALAR
jgi:hypothetical protein